MPLISKAQAGRSLSSRSTNFRTVRVTKKNCLKKPEGNKSMKTEGGVERGGKGKGKRKEGNTGGQRLPQINLYIGLTSIRGHVQVGG